MKFSHLLRAILRRQRRLYSWLQSSSLWAVLPKIQWTRFPVASPLTVKSPTCYGLATGNWCNDFCQHDFCWLTCCGEYLSKTSKRPSFGHCSTCPMLKWSLRVNVAMAVEARGQPPRKRVRRATQELQEHAYIRPLTMYCCNFILTPSSSSMAVLVGGLDCSHSCSHWTDSVGLLSIELSETGITGVGSLTCGLWWTSGSGVDWAVM